MNDVFEGAEIVVVRDEASRSAGAFNRRVGDRVLTFEQGDAGNSEMVDAETGSTWSKLTGVAVTGELEGERLDTYPSFNSFWFGWSDYYPNTEVWVSGSVSQFRGQWFADGLWAARGPPLLATDILTD